MTSDILVLEGGDRRCVQLLLELRRLVVQAAAGTTIEVRTTDPAAPLDLPAWCHLTGHSYLGRTGTGYQLRTIAAPTPTSATSPWHTRQLTARPLRTPSAGTSAHRHRSAGTPQ